MPVNTWQFITCSTGIYAIIVVCDTILIDGNYQQHNISLVTLVVLSDLCKENNYCKTASLNACGLLLLLWTNLENISWILIFTDLGLPRNCAKIGCSKNFPFYCILLYQEICPLSVVLKVKLGIAQKNWL